MKFKYSLAFFSLFTLPSFAQSRPDCPDILKFPESVLISANPPFYPQTVNFSVVSLDDAQSKQLSDLSLKSGAMFLQATLTLILNIGDYEWSQPLPYLLTKSTTYNLRMTYVTTQGDNSPGFRPRTWTYYYSYFYRDDPKHICNKEGTINLTQ